MAADFLLRPDNRSLGFATGDFSFYGAQPSIVATLSPADVGGANDIAREPASPISPPNTEAAPASYPADEAAEIADLPSARGDSGVTPSSSLIAPNGHTDPAGDLAFTAAALPASASLSPAQALQPTAISPIGGENPDTAASGEPIDVASLLGSDNVFSLTAAELAPLVASLSDLTPVGSSLAGILAITSANVAGLADTVLNQATGAVEGFHASLDQTGLAQLDGLVSSAVQDVADTDLGEVVAEQASLVVGVLAGPVESATDIDVLSFGGTDPAAGIDTLVDLVTTTELFAIGAPEAVVQPDASSSVVDDLIGADAVPILDGHHGDGVDDLHDHLGLGL